MKKKKTPTPKFAFNEQRVINSFAQFNTELDEYIGCEVIYKNPSCTVEKETFKVRHIQKDYKGELCLNLIGITENFSGKGWIGSFSHQFGRPASLDKLTIIKRPDSES